MLRLPLSYIQIYKNQAGISGLVNYQNNKMLVFSKVIKNKSDEEGFEPPTF